MARNATLTGAAHPAPYRHHVGTTLLVLILFVVPLLWGIRLVANFAIASHFCFPGDLRRYALPNPLGWVWPTMIGIDVLTILIALAAILVSYRNWRIASEESAGPRSPLIEIGEGRTRFLSMWGLLIGALFVIAVSFDLVALFIVPVCG
jgi:hypothetical protein